MTLGTINLISDLAENFWKEAELSPIYPLQVTILEQAICLQLPIDIVRLNKLSAYNVVSWLAERNCKIELEQDCSLCGLLFIQKGQGIVFLNGTLSIQEQCYTVAHEIGHYLLEFEHPRKKANLILGDKIEDVFWGLRKPTIEEELTGIIRQANVSPYIHLLEVERSSPEERFQVWTAEGRADALAMELLAPFKRVCAEMNVKGRTWAFSSIREELPEILVRQFGLPQAVAKQYATLIAYRLFPHGDSLIDFLKQL